MIVFLFALILCFGEVDDTTEKDTAQIDAALSGEATGPEVAEEQCGDLSLIQQLYNAAIMKEFDQVRELGKRLEESEHHIDDPVTKGQSTLFGACIAGSTNVVRYLNEQLGADLYFKDESGNDCLYVAAVRGHFQLFKFLLEKDFDPLERKYTNGLTAMHVACSSYHGRKTQKILNYVQAKGYDLDEVKSHDETCLMLAVTGKHPDLVSWLLKKKLVNPNEANEHGRTALHYAFHGAGIAHEKGELEGWTYDTLRTIIHTLIRQDANLWALDEYGVAVVNNPLFGDFFPIKPEDGEEAPAFAQRVLDWVRNKASRKKRKTSKKKKKAKVASEIPEAHATQDKDEL